MTQAQVDILLRTRADLSGAAQIRTSFTSLVGGAGQVERAFGSMGKSIAAGFGFGSGFALLTSGVAGIRELFKSTTVEGVKFNAIIEQAALGIASVLRTFNPERFKTFDDAVRASTGIIDELKKKALETPATFEELLQAFQGTAGSMAAAGIPLRQQVQLMVNISQAMAALGIQTAEMRQEATALLLGNIDRNARLAQTLGITAEQIRTAKEQGNLYGFLTEKLKEFNTAAGFAAQTINVLESNLKDATTQAAANATKELADAYRGLLQSLTDLVQSDAFKGIMVLITRGAGAAVDGAKAISDFISNESPTSKTGSDRAGLQSSKLNDRVKAVASPEERAKLLAEVRQQAEGLEADIEDIYRQQLDGGRVLTGSERDRGAFARSLLPNLRKAEKFLQTPKSDELVAQNGAAKAAEDAAAKESEKAARIRSEMAAAQKAAEEREKEIEKNQSKGVREIILADQNQLEAQQARKRADNARREAAEKLASSEADRKLGNELFAIEVKRQQIENDRFSTAAEKQASLMPLYAQENALIEKRVELLAAEIQLMTDPVARQAAQARIDALQQRSAANSGQSAANAPLGLGDQIKTDLVQLQDQFGTVSQSISRLLTNNIGNAVQGVSDGIYGMITRTATWGQVWLSVGATALKTLIDMGTQQGILFVKGLFFTKANAAAQAQAGAEIAASNAPAAAATSISSYGGAAVAGAAAAGIAIGAIIAMLASGGFADGGRISGPGTGTSDSILIRASNNEFMMREAAARSIGYDNLAHMNRTGQLPGSAGGSSAGPSSAGRAPAQYFYVNMDELLRDRMNRGDFDSRIQYINQRDSRG